MQQTPVPPNFSDPGQPAKRQKVPSANYNQPYNYDGVRYNFVGISAVLLMSILS
jgi:hypothetical protein